MYGLGRNALAEMMADNSEPGVQYSPRPQNYLLNNNTGEMTDFGESQPSNGLGIVGRQQNPDGTLTVYERVAGMDGFGRQTARVIERTITPDYMNPAVQKQMEHRKRVADLQKAEAEARQGGRPQAPSGYRWTADGTGVEKLPGMEPTKPTEFESKAATYGARALQAHQQLEKINSGGKIVTPSVGNTFAGAVSTLPGVGELLSAGIRPVTNKFATPEEQQVEQAMLQFRNATLRQESGAAIGTSEHTSAIRQYFPEPGDDADTIDAKRRAREAVIRGFKVQGGRHYDEILQDTQIPDLPQPSVAREDAPASPTFAALPNPAPFKGKRMADDEGNVYMSNGIKWMLIKKAGE